MKQEVSMLIVTGMKYEITDEMWPKINAWDQYSGFRLCLMGMVVDAINLSYAMVDLMQLTIMLSLKPDRSPDATFTGTVKETTWQYHQDQKRRRQAIFVDVPKALVRGLKDSISSNN